MGYLEGGIEIWKFFSKYVSDLILRINIIVSIFTMIKKAFWWFYNNRKIYFTLWKVIIVSEIVECEIILWNDNFH